MKQVAVIGAGVMGAGIAGQLANNDCKVILFDFVNEQGSIAQQSIDMLIKSAPPALVHLSKSQLITPANVKTDLALLRDCDLIIEAIVENLEAKHQFYKNIEQYIGKKTLIGSNTSTFQLKQLKEGLSTPLANKILITHFFNPPRYMPLLEFINDEACPSENKENLINFLTHKAGKTVINCKDTPGFIANRIGCFLLSLALKYQLEAKIDLEVTDYIFSKFLGFPNTAIFGLYDLIGLDVMEYINKSLISSLDKKDYFHKIYTSIPQLTNLINKGYKGRKGLGGFYRLTKNADGVKQKEVLDLTTWQYRPLKKTNLSYDSLEELLSSTDKVSTFVNKILREFFWYILTIHSDIADNYCDIDKAMQLGYNWRHGPFELMQHIGYDRLIEEFKKHELELPIFLKNNLYQNINLSSCSIKPNALASVIKNQTPVLANESANLWRLGNKFCFEITTKMGALDKGVFELLSNSITYAEEQNLALIIYSDQKNFSAGANLNIFLNQIKNQNFTETNQLLALGQRTMLQLKYASVPIIACARGLALGGGCEILLHADYVIAHQDLTAGLVETSLGLIPGWGGLKEMILRSLDNNRLQENINLILDQYKSSSALDFAEKFTHNNVISIANTNDLLNYALEHEFNKNSSNLRTKINNKNIKLTYLSPTSLSDISALIEDKIKKLNIFSEEELLTLEREIFLELIKKAEVKEKINNILKK